MTNRYITFAFLPFCVNAQAQNEATTLFTKGDAPIANMVVDTAPGSVSAMSLLGVSGDQTFAIENPRNLTLAAKALDDKQAFGLSITPARTSLLPLNISTYNERPWARLWAATTFSYAQGKTDIEGKSYQRRAIAIETSYFFFPHKDDPLVTYWDALASAAQPLAGGKIDESNVCVLIPPQKPDDNKTEDQLNKEISARAQACRDKVAASARWNASRAWASLATGEYKADDGGASRGLGRTAVLGLTYGIGETTDKTSAAITVAAKRTEASPVLSSYGAATPTRKDSNLVTLRFAAGSRDLRVLLEGSNISDGDPTATERTYKRAFGLDAKISEGLWVTLRVGKQRRINSTGDETGSALTLSYSPKGLLNF